MELRTLKYFLAVARTEGISRAADVLNVTQPTLSRQMAQLEEDLGVTLFERGARKIALTNEGVLFKRRAEEILSLVEKTEKELLEQEGHIEGKISIGCGELATVRLFPGLIKTFRQKYPLVTYDIITATADVIKEQMEKGLIDIGVLLEPVDMEKFDFIRFERRERWAVLMKADDPLAQKPGIAAEDLRGAPLILPRRANVQNEVALWFGDSFDEKNVLFTSNLRTNGALMVQAGLGYSVVIDGAVPVWGDAGECGIVSRPLKPELAANSVIAWKKAQPFSLAAQKFIELVKSTYTAKA